MSHVRLPYNVVSTKYPGYFWDISKQRLLTIKVSGELRELKRIKPNHWNNGFDGYRVSVKGVRKNLYMDYLRGLEPHYHIIPIVSK